MVFFCYDDIFYCRHGNFFETITISWDLTQGKMVDKTKYETGFFYKNLRLPFTRGIIWLCL